MKLTMLFVTPADLLVQIKTLPSSPQMLPQLLRFLDDVDSGLEGLANLIRLERSLAARVMRFANSPVFRGALPCSSVEEAVQRVGYLAVHQHVATMLALEPLAKPLRVYNCTPGELWRQAIATACAARVLAAMVDEDPNRAYMLGLMHNVGMVVIDRLVRDKDPAVRLMKAAGPDEWRAAEMAMLGFDQADAGAQILASWQFPAAMVKAIRYQFRPEAAGGDMRLAAIILLARWVRCHIGQPVKTGTQPDATITHILGCQPGEIASLITKVEAEVATLWESLRLDQLPAQVSQAG